jgi:hypothetical protein
MGYQPQLAGHLHLASDQAIGARPDPEPTSSDQVFVVLETVIDAFLNARGEDHSVSDTLAITQVFLVALREAGCLESFSRLPIHDQSRFLGWIGGADVLDLRTKRTETFIAALQASPMASGWLNP